MLFYVEERLLHLEFIEFDLVRPYKIRLFKNRPVLICSYKIWPYRIRSYGIICELIRSQFSFNCTPTFSNSCLLDSTFCNLCLQGSLMNPMWREDFVWNSWLIDSTLWNSIFVELYLLSFVLIRFGFVKYDQLLLMFNYIVSIFRMRNKTIFHIGLSNSIFWNSYSSPY